MNFYVWKPFLNTRNCILYAFSIDRQIHQNISQKNFTNIFDEFLQKTNRENKEIIIVGDINCNYFDRNNCKDVKELFSNNGFTQIVNDATRVNDIYLFVLYLQLD